MPHFKLGDLAVTCNSRAPLLNDNHVVRITKVAGPIPDQEIDFGYLIERIDGQNFVLEFDCWRRPKIDQFLRVVPDEN